MLLESIVPQQQEKKNFRGIICGHLCVHIYTHTPADKKETAKVKEADRKMADEMEVQGEHQLDNTHITILLAACYVLCWSSLF